MSAARKAQEALSATQMARNAMEASDGDVTAARDDDVIELIAAE